MASSLFLAAGLTGCVAPSQVGGQNEALGSSGLVVSQVFPGGGNGDASYLQDYVVVFNRGTTTIPLIGYAVWYHSGSNGGSWAGGTALSVTASLAPGQSWLVIGNGGGAVGTDISGQGNSTESISISEANGSIAIAPPVVQPTTFTDVVGWGTPTTGGDETTAATAVADGTHALFRKGGGCTDTDDNASDFETAPASPVNASATATPCTAATVDMTTASDMAQASTSDGSTTTTGTDGSTTTGSDGGPGPGPSSDAGDGVVGNRPQQNGVPTYAPGGNLSSDCSVSSFGGNAGRVGASALVATLLAGLAMRLRRRRA